MILEYLEIKNFLSHKHTKVDFSPQINLFLGENGSGKSSLLDAIAFALYGINLRAERNRDLIHYGEHSASVEAVIRHRNWVVNIQRQISQAGTRVSSRWYRIAGGERKEEKKIRSESELKRELEELLQMDGVAFRNLCFSAQGEMEALLEASPAERKSALDRILGIEKMEKISEWLKTEIIRQEKARLEERSVSLTNELYRLMQENDKVLTELTQINRNLSELESDYSELQNRLKRAETEWEEWQKKKEQCMSYRERWNALEEREKKLSNDLQQIEAELLNLTYPPEQVQEWESAAREFEQVISLVEEQRKYQDAHKARWEAIVRYRSEKESIVTELGRWRKETHCENSSGLEARLLQAEVQLEEMKKNYEHSQERRQKSVEKVTEIKTRLKQLQSMVESLKVQKAPQCPICGSPLTIEHRAELLKEWEQERNNLNARLAELEKEQRDLERSIRKLRLEIDLLQQRIGMERNLLQTWKRKEEEYEKISELLSEHSGFIRDWEEREDTRKSLELRKTQLQEKYERYQAYQRDLERVHFLKGQKETKEMERKEVRRRKEEIQHALEVLAYSEEKYEEARSRLSVLQEKEREIFGMRKEILAKKEALERKKEEMEEGIREIEEERARNQGRERRIVQLELLAKAFSREGVPALLRAQFLERFSQQVNEYFARFRLDFSSVEVVPEVSGDLVFRLNRLDGPSLDWHQLSGGEKICLALATRLAIANVKTGEPLESLILDEPTIFLDRERRSGLIDALKSAGEFLQLIVVSHDEEISEAVSAAGGKVFFLKKEQNVSQVTSV
ncbi:MAG: AAA family ATPase [bacterium JZ-2024 1]